MTLVWPLLLPAKVFLEDWQFPMLAVHIGVAVLNVGECCLQCRLQKTCYKKLVTHVESHASAVSARQRRRTLYIKAIIIINVSG